MTTTTQLDPLPLDDVPDYLADLRRRAHQAHSDNYPDSRDSFLEASTRYLIDVLAPAILQLSRSGQRRETDILPAAQRALDAITIAVADNETADQKL